MKITHVHDEEGDWEGIYVDGRLMAEGHSLRPDVWHRLLEKLGATVEVHHNWPGEAYGHLPMTLDELKEQLK